MTCRVPTRYSNAPRRRRQSVFCRRLRRQLPATRWYFTRAGALRCRLAARYRRKLHALHAQQAAQSATSMRLVSIALLTMALSVSLCPGAGADTPDNVRVAKRVFLESVAEGRFDRLDEIYGPNFVAHGASADYTLEQDSAATKSWRAAMPDLKVTVERTVAGNDLVAVHCKVIGTNTVAAGGM